MQEQLLDKQRNASLRVFAVWYAMYPGDARARWRRDLLTDDRVMHWWDERRLLGRQVLVQIQPYSQLRAPGSRDFQEQVLWDAYLLFDRKARWDQSPSGLVSWGYTVMTTRSTLAEQVGRLLQSERAP